MRPGSPETAPTAADDTESIEDIGLRWNRQVLERIASAPTAVEAAGRVLRFLVPRARDGFAAILCRSESTAPWPVGHGLSPTALQSLARTAPEMEVEHASVRCIESREFRTLGLYDAFPPRDRAKIDRLVVARAGNSLLVATVAVESPNSRSPVVRFLPTILESIEQRVEDDDDRPEASDVGASSHGSESAAEIESAREALARASHEIRTPMNGILGMARFLEETSMTPEQRDYLQVLRSSSESLLQLVNETLDGDEHRTEAPLRPRPTSIRNLVSTALRTLSATAAEKRVELIIDVEPTVPDVLHLDGERLRQVLLNLVGNALKFTAVGDVVLSVRRLEKSTPHSKFERLAFSVRDKGIGIPEDRWEAIFEDRTQAEDTTRERFGGTGLGLGICRELVDRMGGRLQLQSEVDVGSTFEFVLPVEASDDSSVLDPTVAEVVRSTNVALEITNSTLNDAVAAQLKAWGATVVDRPSRNVGLSIGDGAAELHPGAGPRIRLTWPGDANANRGITLLQPFSSDDLLRVVETALTGSGGDAPATAQVTAPSERFGTRPVLLVDDDPISRRLLAEYLRRFGHESIEASDGGEALDLVASTSVAAVLLDYSLPGLGGDEVARRMRGSGVTSPIVAVTGRTDLGATSRLESAGVDHVLTKPVDPKTLQTILARLPENPGRDDEATVFAPEVDDADLLAELVDLFRETAPPVLDRLRQGVRTLDVDEIVATAHRLKGAAAVIGGIESAELLAELEQGPHDPRNLASLVPRVEMALARLDAQLTRFVDAPEESLRTGGCSR